MIEELHAEESGIEQNEGEEQRLLHLAEQCLQDRKRLKFIVSELASDDDNRVRDAARVLTLIAERDPSAVAPFAEELALLLSHREAKTRWEATYALALVAKLAPKTVAFLLPRIHEILSFERDDLIRENSIRILSNYAQTSRKAAESVYPILLEVLNTWGIRHAALVMKGLGNVVAAVPRHAQEANQIAMRYTGSIKESVGRAAEGLKRIVQQVARQVE